MCDKVEGIMKAVKAVLVGLCLAFCFSGVALADCESESRALQARVAQVDSSGWGICKSAETLARIYDEAADLLDRCPMLDMSGQDAQNYRIGAQQARETAAASCG